MGVAAVVCVTKSDAATDERREDGPASPPLGRLGVPSLPTAPANGELIPDLCAAAEPGATCPGVLVVHPPAGTGGGGGGPLADQFRGGVEVEDAREDENGRGLTSGG